MTAIRRLGRRIRLRAGSRTRGERGSLSVVTVLWSLVIVMVAALVIDGGLAISQRERAADLADQAARAEAQNLDLGNLRQHGTATIVNDDCQRATAYLKNLNVLKTVNAGASAALDTTFGNEGVNRSHDGCELGPGNTVTVSVNITYRPLVFDPIFGGGSITVNETGTATVQAGTQ